MARGVIWCESGVGERDIISMFIYRYVHLCAYMYKWVDMCIHKKPKLTIVSNKNKRTHTHTSARTRA